MTTQVSMKRHLRSGNIVEATLGFAWLKHNWGHLKNPELKARLMQKETWVGEGDATAVANDIVLAVLAGDSCDLPSWRKVIDTFVRSIVLILNLRRDLFEDITWKDTYNAKLCYSHLEALRMGYGTGLGHYKDKITIYACGDHK